MCFFGDFVRFCVFLAMKNGNIMGFWGLRTELAVGFMGKLNIIVNGFINIYKPTIVQGATSLGISMGISPAKTGDFMVFRCIK